MNNLISILCLIPLLNFAQQPIVEKLEIKNAAIQIPGTLSYPNTSKKVPLAIFIHGSGNIDRDGNQGGTPVQAAYIKTLADSLNSRGIAMYRYDKRTAVPENAQLHSNILIHDFVSDVGVIVKHFKNDKRFSSLHLIGHSQGSLVGMLSINNEISSFISISGLAQSIDKKIIEQVSAQNPVLGEITEQHFNELFSSDTIAKVSPMLLQIFAPQNQRFLKNWAALSPEVEILKLKIPVLILNGDADIQVSIYDAENLHKALAGSQLKIVPNMNHVLKTVYTPEENQNAYTDKKFPLSSVLIQEITDFIIPLK